MNGGASDADQPVTPDAATAASAGHPAVDAILASRTFKKATALRSLLRYLWDHRHEDIAEYAIAVDALGRPADFDPRTDATVRVQIGRLRQKLKEYYEDEGRGSRERLAIPAGKYQLDVISEPAATVACGHERTLARMKTALMAVSALALVLAIACGLLLLRLPGSNAGGGTATRVDGGPLPPFWQAFFHEGRSTKIILSHPVFFRWEGSTLKVRDVLVNDFKELDKSTEIAPLRKKYGQPLLMQNYTVASDTFAAIRLVRYLEGKWQPLTVISSAGWSMDAAEEDNLILLGTAGVSARFRHLVERANFTPVSDGDRVLNRAPRPGEPAEYAAVVESPTRRVAPGFIGLLPAGSRGTRALVLIGVETVSLAHFLSSRSGLAALDEAWRRNGSPAFFEAVVEADVDLGTVLKVDLVAFRAFDATVGRKAD